MTNEHKAEIIESLHEATYAMIRAQGLHNKVDWDGLSLQWAEEMFQKLLVKADEESERLEAERDAKIDAALRNEFEDERLVGVI